MADPTPGVGSDPNVRQMEQTNRRLDDLDSATGTQRGQVMKDLLGRVSYFNTGEELFSLSKGTADPEPEPIWSMPFGEQLTFTLGSRRLVRLVATVSLSSSITSYSVDLSAVAQIHATSIIDGEFGYYSGETDEVSSYVPAGEPITRLDSDSKRARIERYVPMEPGVHTLQVGLKNIVLDGTGTGPWLASVSAYAPTLAVDVLQIIHE